MRDVILAFLPDLWAGFLVNLGVAAGAVTMGLILGLPLAVVRDRIGWTERPIRWAVRLMQAAPVYVVMFFLLNLLPARIYLGPWRVTAIALLALILAQGLNMVAYMEENGLQALRHLRKGERAQALLFLPNVIRGFIVVVMSSGLGAAIGVTEAVGVTLRHAQRLQSLGDRVVLFLLAIAFFASIFGTLNALLRRAMRRLTAVQATPERR